MGVSAVDSRVGPLLGRGRELAALERVLATAREGSSEVLVLRGEPGIGKTALLDYAADRAVGFRTARITGVESELELPFASLHQLCGPLLGGLDRLPPPQRDALSVAFGLRQGRPPNLFLVGLAVLSLLAGSAEPGPIVCLVDDAQWLDRESAQALAFVARRLTAEPIAVVFARRAPDDGSELAGLPELTVEGLSEPAARILLASAVHGPLDPLVRDRIVAEAHGNPLALLQLPRAPGELAGGFWLPGRRPLAKRVECTLSRQLRSIPPKSRQLLLTAAAEPTGDAGLLWRAAGLQEIPAQAAAQAEAAGLAEFGPTTVRFDHPLARSAVYRAASAPDRRAAHRALAEATDPHRDPDRRAWHRAHAVTRPDEHVALDLERSAERAHSRGGQAAAASFLRRATELTPDPAQRVTRALAAAQAHIDTGQPDQARTMLTAADAGPFDELQRARFERLRARLVFSQLRNARAPRLLLDAAQRLAPLDAALARDTLLEALGGAIVAGRLAEGPGQREVAEAVRDAPPPPEPPRALDVLLDSVATRILDGYTASAGDLRHALEAIRRERPGAQPDDDRHRLWLAFHVTPDPIAPELWDDEAWYELADAAVHGAREAGTLSVLPMALTYQAFCRVHAGEFDGAAAMIDEATAISKAVGGAPMMYTSLALSAWRGDESRARKLIGTTVEELRTRGEGRSLGLAEYSNALLYNGLGRYDAALAAATRACRYEDLGFYGWALTELIEAATRSGQRDVAAAALEKLTERTGAGGTEWALGAQACSRALLSEIDGGSDRDGQAADALFREAIEHLERCRIAVQLARARLLYGEWLRRHNRRRESRIQLRDAYESFDRFGAAGFAERARKELLAAGESPRKRTAGGADPELTGQESQIAKLATEGHTNQEIAARLFISPRTVEWHLGNVFAKLGVSSRRQLRSTLTQ